jgi:hypothetical protein
MRTTRQVRTGRALALAGCATALAGCISTGEVEQNTVVRTRPPIDYEKTINSYFLLTLRNQPKNRKVDVSKPVPGGCPVGGTPSSERGWVVPVAYTTYSGVPGGKDVITIITKEYYFWFRESTIAGVTGKIEICP